MIQRQLIEKIKEMATKMPVISVTGPRQSGKTTLAKLCFPNYSYVNLENPDTYQAAVSDPRLFLTQFQSGLIIDEVQRLPELFSYIPAHRIFYYRLTFRKVWPAGFLLLTCCLSVLKNCSKHHTIITTSKNFFLMGFTPGCMIKILSHPYFILPISKHI